jgi:transcriptional regulator GlxA family with amidase domain
MYRIGVDIGRVGSPIIAANALSNYHTMDELLRLVLVMIEDVRKRIADLGPSDSRTKRMLLKIHEQTEAHFFQQDFSLSELAEHMGMSQSALSHFYRESTKSTLQEYVNTLRLNRAKDLLKQGLPLKAVVPLVGFHDISRFIKKFRKNAGMTPGQYARLYRDQSIR